IDIRRAFDQFTTMGFFQKKYRRMAASTTDVLIKAISVLAESRIGALIVIEGREPLDSYLDGGFLLNGRISFPLLHSLFHPHSSGHDGAAIIHDWEFSYIGQTSEHVRQNVERGEFGNWEETGYFINLAINIGAYEGRGYGESVGALIENEGLAIPAEEDLRLRCRELLDSNPEQAAAAADLLGLVRRFRLRAGWMPVTHRWKRYSPQAAAFRLGIPFTGHPMIGHDIIYNHPMNHGASLGRAALRDFLSFASSISRIEGGVYLSVGSAVMSPMIFEKSLSMAQNLAAQLGQRIRDHYILVVDLAESAWDWSRGEPPESDPAYYLRYNKSFSRMGGTMRYLRMDNRDFLLHLHHRLERTGRD
ncbi:MAG: DNA integrity scanning protein DisA nucleotide-binding domain protein, partial [Acidobacteria bacterium]|nr:DNA integrity scanning protein DisA nucleotide-binding domain protein [Acidobacteriota bacterium]